MRKLSICPGAVQVITRKIKTEASISVLRLIMVRIAILDHDFGLPFQTKLVNIIYSVVVRD